MNEKNIMFSSFSLNEKKTVKEIDGEVNGFSQVKFTAEFWESK